MTRTPDKFIAAAFWEHLNAFGFAPDDAFSGPLGEIRDRAEQMHQHELNPKRVKCSKCPGMMATPTPCMNPDCGFRK